MTVELSKNLIFFDFSLLRYTLYSVFLLNEKSLSLSNRLDQYSRCITACQTRAPMINNERSPEK